MYRIWNRFIRVDTLLMAALLICTTLLLAYQGLLTGFDRNLYDANIRLFQRPASTDIVIVEIDDESLDSLRRWPWAAEYQEQLLQKLMEMNARSISLNFPYQPDINNLQGSDSKPADELREAQSATKHADLIRPTAAEDADERVDSTQPSSWPVRISLAQDTDGIVRSLYLENKYAPHKWDNHYLILTGNTIINSGITDTESDAEFTSIFSRPYRQKNGRIYIPYTGPAGHYQRIQFYKVINGEVPREVFHDKYVIVGITAAGTGHSYPVPPDGFTDPMDDVEIMANILAAFTAGTYIKPVELVWYLAYSGILALIPFLLFTFYSPRVNALVTILLVVAVLSISVLLVKVFQLWLPPAAALVAVVVSYLMWSSRRLHNAVNYLGRELVHLNAEMAVREVDLTSRLGSAFFFLENILPLAGWYIADVDGNIKYTNGQKPRLSSMIVSPGTWKNDGNQLWTSVLENQQKLDIGIRWSTLQGPMPMEKEFLEGFLEQFTGTADSAEHESIEVVEKLITQVQRAIINLRTMHQFFDDCIAQMADGLLVTNELGKVLFANERAAVYVQGHAINNPAGKDIFKLLENLESVGPENTKDLLRRAYLERIPLSINASNHQRLELLLQITPLLRGRTGMDGIIITLSDISYLKAIERARNETISFVSHDLRSPLVSILALLELVKNCKSPEELTQLHKRIGEYTQLTISMAEQFIQLARVESEAEIKLEEMDLVSTAINAYEQVWFQAQSRKINLVRSINLDHAWVMGERSLLERAIINLLNNAIKYSPEGKTVRMNLLSDGDNICCCIEDQGYGIPRNELPSLFDRFHRVHSNSGVDEQGIGLGLALVKATAERHRGDIQVTSDEGHGSRFCLLIPKIKLKKRVDRYNEEPDAESLAILE
jgi:signal transduction histidine kinase/CHASE2 domain-containing sensor protein